MGPLDAGGLGAAQKSSTAVANGLGAACAGGGLGTGGFGAAQKSSTGMLACCGMDYYLIKLEIRLLAIGCVGRIGVPVPADPGVAALDPGGGGAPPGW